MKLKNPFLTAGYAGEEYFCDRVNETARMIAAFENDRNLTLIAPRRYGKTGLIRNAFAKMPKEFIGIYLDIFVLDDLASFAAALASAVTSALEMPVEKTHNIVPSAAIHSLEETFAYLKEKEQRIVIAIDEFQQITEFPEHGVEAMLRSQIQFVPWVRFVFAGSRHHVMSEMFGSAKRPFYQSTEILSLDTINRPKYAEFAKRHFTRQGTKLNEKAFAYLYDRFDGITWYVQSVLNRIWEGRAGLSAKSQVDETVASLVAGNSLVYHDLYRSQNVSSQRLLKAIAHEGCVAEPTAGTFLSRYGFVSHSTVRSALTNLVNNDLLYRTDLGYVVYDRFFGHWLNASHLK